MNIPHEPHEEMLEVHFFVAVPEENYKEKWKESHVFIYFGSRRLGRFAQPAVKMNYKW